MATQEIPDSAMRGNPDIMVILHGYGPMNDTIGSSSPYVAKVETYLRMNNIPYEVQVLQNTDLSPKGTAPFIEHGDTVLADSTFILDYLANTYANKIVVKPNENPRERGIAVAVQRLCEDHLDCGVVWHRFTNEEGYAGMKAILAKELKFPSSLIIPGKYRKAMVSRSLHQGFGRHSRRDVYSLLQKSMAALSDILGESDYITGKDPCPEDCIAFSILDVYLHQKIIQNDPLRSIALKYSNLVDYVERMRARYYPVENPSKFRMESELKKE